MADPEASASRFMLIHIWERSDNRRLFESGRKLPLKAQKKCYSHQILTRIPYPRSLMLVYFTYFVVQRSCLFRIIAVMIQILLFALPQYKKSDQRMHSLCDINLRHNFCRFLLTISVSQWFFCWQCYKAFEIFLFIIQKVFIFYIIWLDLP